MSKKIDSKFLSLWARRFIVYMAGLYCMAIGVVFSARSALGVSPVGSLANVLYQIGLAQNAPSFVNLGNCTTAVYCLYILTEFIILRKNFKPHMLLQLVASLLFGQLVNLATLMMSPLPDPANYAIQIIYLLCSVVMVALGVMLYLSPNILPTPGEGMSLAISSKTGWSVGSSKTLFDCTMVVISVAVSLLYFHRLVGVREGTVICALLVGFTMKQMQKVCQEPLLRFVGREFGSGGDEVGELLAKKLGITFYDTQLNEMASKIGGIPLSKVEELEHHMTREIFLDFSNAAYAMTNNSLDPEEELFVAQTTAIRQIAAGDESCVIMGRCADYVLYDDPNCFRLFIHARPSARIARIMNRYGLDDEEQAKIQMVNTDRSRARHYKRFTGRDYGKQEYYHLGVDSGMLGTEASVEVICAAIRRWCDVRGTHPLYALRDE